MNMHVEAEAMPGAQGGWSSLPADLVNRVADCLLATNDLDCYADLRAVCHHWRSCTADPRSESNQLLDPRFRPRRWVMLGEINYYARRDDDDDEPFLFVNTATGRFVRRRLPSLRGYHLVTTTTDGFLVVEDADGSYPTLLLNPFTGSSIRFKARMPSEESMTAEVVFLGDRPRVVLAARSPFDDEFTFYLAGLDSKEFRSQRMTSIFSRYAMPRLHVRGPSRFFETTGSRLPFLPWLAAEVAHGEILLVHRHQYLPSGLAIYGLSSPGTATERVTSIGDYALFVGTGRCISVRAGTFPSIKANCIYYKKRARALSGVYCVYDLAHGSEETIARSGVLPATVAQLLADYTVCSSQHGHLRVQSKWKASRRSI